MDQRISLITLGVTDVSRSRAFYERMGWHGQEVEETVFFQAGCMALVVWHQDKLARDAGFAPVGGSTFRGVCLAQHVRSADEVDAVLRRASRAGGVITQEAAPTFYGGYAGYFSDPDGHVWEIAHNPAFPLADDGAITIPDLEGGGDSRGT